MMHKVYAVALFLITTTVILLGISGFALKNSDPTKAKATKPAVTTVQTPDTNRKANTINTTPLTIQQNDTTILSAKYGYKFTIPYQNIVSGTAENFTITLNGIPNSLEPRSSNAGVLTVRVYELLGKTLYEAAYESDFEEKTTKSYEELNTPYFQKFTLAGITGYKYTSIPATNGEINYNVFFLPLKKDPTKYLFILKSDSDANRQEYAKRLEDVIQSFEYIP